MEHISWESIHTMIFFRLAALAYVRRQQQIKAAVFQRMAYRVIWNEICSALIYASRRSATELTIDPELMDVPEPPGSWGHGV